MVIPLLLGATACTAEDIVDEDLAMESAYLDLPNPDNKVHVLGDAVDSGSQKFFPGPCVESVSIDSKGKVKPRPPIVQPTAHGFVVFDKAMTQEQLDTMFGVETGFKARYGAVNGSARASFTRSSKSEKTSINVVFGATYDIKTARFDSTGARVIPGVDLALGCGDSYISEINYGADLAILYRIDFASDGDKTAFETAMSGNYAGLAQGSASAKATAASFKSRASVHVEIRQFGGDVTALAEALDTDATTDCAMDNLEACNKMVKNGLHYAATTFKTSAATSPGVRTLTIEDYSMLHLPSTGEVLPTKLVNAREDLAEIYDNELEVRDRVLSLSSGLIQLSVKQKQNLDKVRTQSSKNMAVLKNIVPLCFDKIDLGKPATINDCASAITKASLKAKGFVALDVSVLDFPIAGGKVYNPGKVYVRNDWLNNVSLGQGDWGTPRDWEYCPAGQYAIGYHMRVEQRQGDGDDTALNAVTLRCGKIDHEGSATGVTIDSYPGLWGDQFAERLCVHGVVRGGKMKIEDNMKGDDTAANDVILTCSDGIDNPRARCGEWGDWADGADRKNTPAEVAPALCDPGSAVCGIQVRFEKAQHDGDDTALNGITFACCAF